VADKQLSFMYFFYYEVGVHVIIQVCIRCESYHTSVVMELIVLRRILLPGMLNYANHINRTTCRLILHYPLNKFLYYFFFLPVVVVVAIC